jgi:hypothetical protein
MPDSVHSFEHGNGENMSLSDFPPVHSFSLATEEEEEGEKKKSFITWQRNLASRA